MKLNIPACRDPEHDEIIHIRIPVSRYELDVGLAGQIRQLMATNLADRLSEYCTIYEDSPMGDGTVFFHASIRVGDFSKERERTRKLRDRIDALTDQVREAQAEIDALKRLNADGIKEQ